MMSRWTLQCANLETGEVSTKTFVGEDEASVRAGANIAGFLVKKVISTQRLDTDNYESSKPRDLSYFRWTAVQNSLNRADSLRIPLDNALQTAWMSVGFGIVGVVIGVLMLVFGPNQTSPVIFILGAALSYLGGGVFSLGVLAAIILTAARSICICVLLQADHKPT